MKKKNTYLHWTNFLQEKKWNFAIFLSRLFILQNNHTDASFLWNYSLGKIDVSLINDHDINFIHKTVLEYIIIFL